MQQEVPRLCLPPSLHSIQRPSRISKHVALIATFRRDTVERATGSALNSKRRRLDSPDPTQWSALFRRPPVVAGVATEDT